MYSDKASVGVEEGEGESEMSEGGRILCGSSPLFIQEILMIRTVIVSGIFGSESMDTSFTSRVTLFLIV